MPGRGRDELLLHAGMIAVTPGCVAAREGFSLLLNSAADGGTQSSTTFAIAFQNPASFSLLEP